SENANKDAKTISVQRDLLAGISSRDYYLNKIIPEHIKLAHIKGEIHLHDLDYLLFRETNCELVNIEAMLRGGCNIGNAKMLEPDLAPLRVLRRDQILPRALCEDTDCSRDGSFALRPLLYYAIKFYLRTA
ncbi:anaerobic ribonucleoside-triphosphate reductase, partial [uncultured Campylobacter sp.]|uniref:anaerobic ribonucleoside-triphosphate reductase n=1 Tax=uncultured Campylobacter sp. TaxID=218934 RepID=UPI0026257D0C